MTSLSELPHQPDIHHQQPPRSFTQLKVLTPIVAILLSAVMAGTGGYLLGIKNTQSIPTSQPSPTVIVNMRGGEWKKYTNEQLGLSFNYPNDWKVNNKVSNSENYQFAHRIVYLAPLNYVEDNYAISLLYYENPENLSLDELNKKLTGNSGIGPELSTESAKRVKMSNGVTAYYQKDYVCEPSICQAYIYSYKGKVFQLINYPPPAPQYRITNQTQIFNKILSSLKIR
jgi:hypothetical protein